MQCHRCLKQTGLYLENTLAITFGIKRSQVVFSTQNESNELKKIKKANKNIMKTSLQC